MARRAQLSLLGVAGCVGALLLVWAAAFRLPFGRWADAATLTGFVDLHSPFVDRVAGAVAAVADPQPFLLLGAALVAVALVRGRPRAAAVVPLVLAGSNLTTQLLKPALADPRLSQALSDTHINPASWPSGHATAAMSLALCAVLVAPARRRPLVAALAAAFAVATSYSVLTLAWHFPSDVLGGFLVAAGWALLGVAGLSAAAARWPARAGRRAGREAALRLGEALSPSALAAACALACVGALALARPDAALAYAQAHTTFVAGAAVIASLGALLAAGLAVALRR